MSAKCQILI